MGLSEELLAVIGENDKTQEPTQFLNTGFPPLNYAISGRYDGGMPAGRMVEMFGPPSSGKTLIATKVMAAAQKLGGIAGYSDHERSFDVGLARDNGLDTTAPAKGVVPNWIFKTPTTFEESVATAIRVGEIVRKSGQIADDAPLVWVFDSLASMVPQSKMEKEVTAFNMNDNTALARATSATFPALMQWCERNNMLALFLNQARTKIGVMYGDPTTTPGGNAPEFYASVRIKLGREMLLDKEKNKIGQRIGAECIKNKIHRPFMKVKWDFLFQPDGSGRFDVVGSMIVYLCDIGVLGKAGAYVVLPDGSKSYRSELAKRMTEAELIALLPKVGVDYVPEEAA